MAITAKQVHKEMENFDLVTIYEDPITCKTTEGTAMLIRRLEHALQGCERWLVKFKGESATYTREVNIANH